MITRFSILTRSLLAVIPLCLLTADTEPMTSKRPSEQEVSKTTHLVRVFIKANRDKYSIHDTIELSVALRNEGDSPVYIDRRMFWGYGGALQLEIRDQQGNPVLPKMRDDAVMPPPPEGDTFVLNRLDEGFFYGTWRTLPALDYFRVPGAYTIRVTYKSWLRKEYVEPHLRSLPAIWADQSAITSDSISVVISP
jgi:hypothetical protein